MLTLGDFEELYPVRINEPEKRHVHKLLPLYFRALRVLRVDNYIELVFYYESTPLLLQT